MLRRVFLSLSLCVFAVSCVQKNESEKILSFERNLVNTKDPELVCILSEDGVLLKNITDFTILSDTSFVVLDRQGVYLYHISGTFIKQFGNSGRAAGEMITPTFVHATDNFVYIWCASLMKFLIFDHEANLINELSGFKRAVKKFVVNSSDEVLYIYTSGFFNESQNKMTDVIDVYRINDKLSVKYGERDPEDEILSTYSNSGGLFVDTEQLVYIHPGNLIIYQLDLNSSKTIKYKIDDRAFHRGEITSNIRDVMDNRQKLSDYLRKSSFVRGLYQDNNQIIIISQIGQSDFNEQTRLVNNQNRKVKLYILDSSFKPNCSILFDYINSPNIVIYSNSLYFISTIINENDQTISLNRFSLSKM